MMDEDKVADKAPPPPRNQCASPVEDLYADLLIEDAETKRTVESTALVDDLLRRENESLKASNASLISRLEAAEAAMAASTAASAKSDAACAAFQERFRAFRSTAAAELKKKDFEIRVLKIKIGEAEAARSAGRCCDRRNGTARKEVENDSGLESSSPYDHERKALGKRSSSVSVNLEEPSEKKRRFSGSDTTANKLPGRIHLPDDDLSRFSSSLPRLFDSSRAGTHGASHRKPVATSEKKFILPSNRDPCVQASPFATEETDATFVSTKDRSDVSSSRAIGDATNSATRADPETNKETKAKPESATRKTIITAPRRESPRKKASKAIEINQEKTKPKPAKKSKDDDRKSDKSKTSLRNEGGQTTSTSVAKSCVAKSDDDDLGRDKKRSHSSKRRESSHSPRSSLTRRKGSTSSAQSDERCSEERKTKRREERSPTPRGGLASLERERKRDVDERLKRLAEMSISKTRRNSDGKEGGGKENISEARKRKINEKSEDRSRRERELGGGERESRTGKKREKDDWIKDVKERKKDGRSRDRKEEETLREKDRKVEGDRKEDKKITMIKTQGKTMERDGQEDDKTVREKDGKTKRDRKEDETITVREKDNKTKERDRKEKAREDEPNGNIARLKWERGSEGKFEPEEKERRSSRKESHGDLWDSFLQRPDHRERRKASSGSNGPGQGLVQAAEEIPSGTERSASRSKSASVTDLREKLRKHKIETEKPKEKPKKRIPSEELEEGEVESDDDDDVENQKQDGLPSRYEAPTMKSCFGSDSEVDDDEDDDDIEDRLQMNITSPSFYIIEEESRIGYKDASEGRGREEKISAENDGERIEEERVDVGEKEENEFVTDKENIETEQKGEVQDPLSRENLNREAVQRDEENKENYYSDANLIPNDKIDVISEIKKVSESNDNNGSESVEKENNIVEDNSGDTEENNMDTEAHKESENAKVKDNNSVAIEKQSQVPVFENLGEAEEEEHPPEDDRDSSHDKEHPNDMKLQITTTAHNATFAFDTKENASSKMTEEPKAISELAPEVIDLPYVADRDVEETSEKPSSRASTSNTSNSSQSQTGCDDDDSVSIDFRRLETLQREKERIQAEIFKEQQREAAVAKADSSESEEATEENVSTPKTSMIPAPDSASQSTAVFNEKMKRLMKDVKPMKERGDSLSSAHSSPPASDFYDEGTMMPTPTRKRDGTCRKISLLAELDRAREEDYRAAQALTEMRARSICGSYGDVNDLDGEPPTTPTSRDVTVDADDPLIAGDEPESRIIDFSTKSIFERYELPDGSVALCPDRINVGLPETPWKDLNEGEESELPFTRTACSKSLMSLFDSARRLDDKESKIYSQRRSVTPKKTPSSREAESFSSTNNSSSFGCVIAAFYKTLNDATFEMKGIRAPRPESSASKTPPTPRPSLDRVRKRLLLSPEAKK